MSRALAIVFVMLATAAAAPFAIGGVRQPTLSSPIGPIQAYPLLGGRRAPVTLFDQTGNDSGSADVSQNFETPYDADDAQGADDFVIPTGHKWIIQQVKVIGRYFNGTGAAGYFYVSFLKNHNGRPGAVIAGWSYFSSVSGTDGSYTFTLPSAVTLKAGTFWLSVQAIMDFDSSGEWGWEMATVQNGNGAVWQNPGDGFGTGCVTWSPVQTCIPPSGGPDFMFALLGADKTR